MSVRVATKICKNCGREITWRKKWEKNWDAIAMCSAACRRPLAALDYAFEAGVLELLSQRRREAVSAHRKGGKEAGFCTVEEVEETIMARWRDSSMVVGAVSVPEEDAIDDAPEPSSDDPRPTSDSPRANPNHVRERARKAARRLVDKNLIEIWQKGVVVNPLFAKGVLELRGVAGLPVDLVALSASEPAKSDK